MATVKKPSFPQPCTHTDRANQPKGFAVHFLGEARIVARLIHPHIVRVLEFGVEDEVPFLVMDYAPDGTLRGRLPRGAPLAAETILPYVKQIADALGYAHAKGLVHRDVKPENMLLGRDDEVSRCGVGSTCTCARRAGWRFR